VPQTWDPAEERTVVGREPLTVVATVDSGTGATVLTATGEVDMLTAPVLRQRLDEHFGADRAPIIVDLSRVEFFGSTALAVIVDTEQRARAEGRSFALVAGTRVVRRPLQVTQARCGALRPRQPGPGARSGAPLSSTAASPETLRLARSTDLSPS
jgi:anti-sigma B factor antagonist